MANRGGIKYIWGPMRTLLRNIPENRVLLGLSIATGALSGLAAVILKLAIHYIQGFLANLHANTPWAYILLPGVGMLLSLLIVRYLIKDNIGHGVTKVLQAVSKNESRIKNHNCWSSVLTSALTIGFGGSVGAEAPIVYTGAAIGSNLGRYCGISYRGMTLLLGCGGCPGRHLQRSPGGRAVYPGNPAIQPFHERGAAPSSQLHFGHPGKLSLPGKGHAV